MPSQDFVHLHCHSTYSLLEGLPSPEEMVHRAQELGQTAVALTDQGHVYGLIELYKAAQKEGIKPILGLDGYFVEGNRTEKNAPQPTTPLTLLAETQEGYQHLLKIATLSAMEGMTDHPRIDTDLLQRYGKGLILLSGPLEGLVAQAALQEDGEKIRMLTEKFQSLVGKDNFFYELMDLPELAGQAEVNQQLIAWGERLGVPAVATCASRYCRREDAEAHDILLCIQRNANVSDPGRYSMRGHDYSMRSTEEMVAAFAHIPDAIANTRRIADRCCVAFDFSTYRIPRFPVPAGGSEDEYLVAHCDEGFARRYPDAPAHYRDRLAYELQIIRQVGFSGYFLIVADFVNEAKRRGITVGPGRGSAAGSMVSYCLGITGVDPMAYDLLFERFLNPERISMPDIDLDFADDRRDEVLTYVRDKYGPDRVAQICTFGTLAARAAVKDVGRAFGIPFLEMNNLAKLIPDKPGTTLSEALQTSELKHEYDTNETYRRIIDASLKLEGKARHVSVHACGVIIAPEDTTLFTALQKAPKDENVIITQYGAKPLESLGLLKMDFLGLMNLTVIQTALIIIERTRGATIDIETIPMDDAATFKLLQQGDTTGVFQLESPGMRRNLKQLKPTQFTDIAAMVALYRPGPMEWISSFIRRKHGTESVQYQHDDLRPVLEPTFGVGIYQEQILQIAQTFAGFSLGEADLLRRAIGKKIKKELDAQRDKFVKGAKAKGYASALAEKIFDDVITPFAGYGFNKSHAVGYALIAYQTAYLKANYPAEFMAALLSADSDDSDRVTIEIEECRAMGIAVLPPDINESRSQFTVVSPEKSDEVIRFGLSAVKGVGESSVRVLIEERERGGRFTSIEDFASRVPLKILNKKLLESLGKAGAFDQFADRRMLVEHYGLIVDYRKAKGDEGGAQHDLFAGIDTGDMKSSTIEFPKTAALTAQQKLTWEKETLGLYVSSHPLAGLSAYIGRRAKLIKDLAAQDIGKKVTIAGIQEGVKKMRTKKGETMAILTIEDPTGKMEVTLFPRVYAQIATLLDQPDTVLVIGGTLDLRLGQIQMRADALKRSSLSGMIARAREEKTFDEQEAARGVRIVRRIIAAADVLDAVDEEGNVVAGEAIPMEKSDGGGTALGPLGEWITKGMPAPEAPIATAPVPAVSAQDPSGISILTIPLPERAPRQLLLDLKKVFQLFPGPERVRLKIGGALIDLPVTVTLSPLMEKEIAEVFARYR